MVGVPGRSTGCHNCKARKIKCDGERPACRNCARSNRICTGYQKKHAFILSKDMVSENKPSSHDKSNMSTDGSTMVMISRWRKDVTKPTVRPAPLSTFSASGGLDMHPQTHGAGSSQQSQLPKEISLRNMVREGLLATCFSDPKSEGCSISLAYGEKGEWISCVLSLPDLTPALEDALLAISTAKLGQRTSRPDLLHESLRLYTKGIAQLHRNLQNPSKRKEDQSLVACMVSLLYEVTASPAGTYDGYMAHYHGTLELLRLRGASSHRSGLAHSVFRIMRMHAIFNSMIACRKTFLADADWLEGPWPQPQNKSPLERLMDILLGLPELTAQRDAQESTNDALKLLSSALESVQTVQQMELRLEQWFEDYRASIPGPLYYPELAQIDSPLDNPLAGRMFPVAFRFPAFVIGQNFVWYFVTLTTLYAHLCSTYTLLAQLVDTLDIVGRETYSCTCAASNAPCLQHFSMDMLPALGHRELWPRATAYNVAQSVEYFLDDTQQTVGPHGIIPAILLIKGLWRYAPVDMSREIAWVDERMERILATVTNPSAELSRKICKQLERCSAERAESLRRIRLRIRDGRLSTSNSPRHHITTITGKTREEALTR